MQEKIWLSVVLPVYNEQGAIGPLLREISATLRNEVEKPAEIIVVDDASTDASIEEVERVISDWADPEAGYNSDERLLLRIIPFSSSTGQARALREGFLAAQGSLILSMDADGQYDPADIPRLIEMVDTFDMVCGIRDRRTDGIARLVCSKIANGFRNLITNDSIKDAGCTFRVMRRECRDHIASLSGTLTGNDFFFHPLIARSGGFRVGEVRVRHRSRVAGGSRYHLVRGRLISGIRACFIAGRTLRNC
jgi:dolichol-phosphate mannosyltransferase